MSMHATPEAQHRWLQQFVGEWTSESRYSMGPGEPEGHSTGRERVRMLGDLWVLFEGEASMPDGSTGQMLLTLGFDPKAQRFRGTWVGSMMTHLWVYEGQLDASGLVLPLDSEGPAMDGEGTARYRDTITIVGPDERLLTSSAPQPDGTWKEFMRNTFRRVG